MDDADRLKLYQGMADVSRKWVATLDAKAGFIAAINAALLGFIWSSAKLPEAGARWPHALGLVSTAFSLLSLCLAMGVVVPRIRVAFAAVPDAPDARPAVKAVSFYGFVATKYAPDRSCRFVDDVWQLSEGDLAREALEQHHAICHVAFAKNYSVQRAGWVWFAALAMTVLGIVVKMAG
jgi:hypothetical protein